MNWDGTCIGNITEYIIDEIDGNTNQIVSLDYKGIIQKVHLKKINREYPYISLIEDELKPYFGIFKIGKHSCYITYNNRESMYIVSKYYENSVKLSDYILKNKITDKSVLYSIKKCFIFKLLCGFCTNYNSKLLVIKIGDVILITTSGNDKLNFGNDSFNGSVIPNTAINNWFKSWKEVYNMIFELFGNDELHTLINGIDNIINRIDRNSILIKSQILSRIESYLYKI